MDPVGQERSIPSHLDSMLPGTGWVGKDMECPSQPLHQPHLRTMTSSRTGTDASLKGGHHTNDWVIPHRARVGGF